MTAPSISAILIVKNEERNLAECLDSISFCSEVVVIDGGSTDRTIEIAHRYKCRVSIQTNWNGFGPQKQQALDSATRDWVLSVDADERITPELAAEIKRSIENNPADGYYIRRRSQYLGRWMRHGGWYPDRVLRLARRENVRFDASPVHERMLVTGQIAELKNPMLHYSYRSIKEILEKQKNYALAGAEIKILKRQKSGVLRAFLQAVWVFLKVYFLQIGFLDGRQGLIAALAKSQETFWKYLATAWPGDRSQP